MLFYTLLRLKGSEKAKCGRTGGLVPDKLRGDEVRSIAALCNKEGVLRTAPAERFGESKVLESRRSSVRQAER